MPCFFICEYSLACRPENLHLMTCSTLSGSSDSTSFFRRRSKNGRSTCLNVSNVRKGTVCLAQRDLSVDITLCNLLMIRSCSSSLRSILSWTPSLLKGVLNHSSKLFTLLKIFGKIKLSNAQSSGRLFYRRVGMG